MNLKLDKEYLKEQQYASTNYLDSRIAIHKFNVNDQSFFEWAWDQMKIDNKIDLLEIGAGPGTFWVDNIKKLPEESSVLITDFSDAMIQKAKKNISDLRFTFEISDIDNLNYDKKFDVVMAHFVLYHSTDKKKSLESLRDLTKEDGYVSITTNSEKHMFNVYEIGKSLDKNFPTDRNIDTFTEEYADKILKEVFSKVEKNISIDFIRINNVQLVLDYVKSAVEPRKIKVNDNFYEEYGKIVQNDIESKGYFEIPKRSPLYRCYK